MLDAGATVAVATDCDPGSCFTSSMPFCIALAVRETGMTPAEAVHAATAGGAAALRRADVGRRIMSGGASGPRAAGRAVPPQRAALSRRTAVADPSPRRVISTSAVTAPHAPARTMSSASTGGRHAREQEPAGDS
ncbi:hypothetical protein ACI797_11765 [Geodermatophilus sp. SYSU D00691]